MSSRLRAVLLVALLLVAAGIATFPLLRRVVKPAPLPLEIALWYWHQPFSVTPSEAAELNKNGIHQLFVLAGTFRRDEEGEVRLVMPQQWKSRADGVQITLVFRCESSLLQGKALLSDEKLISVFRSAVPRECDRVRKAGLKVSGVQFDLDCPTRRLPEYANFLRTLREVCTPQGIALSITALPTWFTSQDIVKVMQAVDFVVPQYYEAQLPQTMDKYATVSNLAKLERGLATAGKTGLPFFAGIPAYGHALVYKRDGTLAGTYRDMGIREVVRYPAFRHLKSFPADAQGKESRPQNYVGEDIHDFAVEGATDSHGESGFRLRFDLPTATLVSRHLALLREKRPANCRGVILFRYPERGEANTLPLPSLLAAIRGEKARPDLKIEMKTATSPWEIIETGQRSDRLPLEITLRVTNSGTASSFFAPDGVTVTLAFDRPGLEESEPGQFDSMESFVADYTPLRNASQHAPIRASLSRANQLYSKKFQLAAGETAKIGPIRLRPDGPTRVRGEWTIRGEGGYDIVKGEIAEMRLETPREKTPERQP